MISGNMNKRVTVNGKPFLADVGLVRGNESIRLGEYSPVTYCDVQILGAVLVGDVIHHGSRRLHVETIKATMANGITVVVCRETHGQS